MARFWSPVWARVGELATGAAGAGRVVPPDVLRADAYPVAPGSPEYPGVNEERTVEVLAKSGGHANRPLESPYVQGIRHGRCDLVIAYQYELDLPEVPAPDPAGGATTRARARASDDVEVVMRALTWPGNYGTLSNGSVLVSIEPDGDWRIDDRAAGVLLLTQPLLVRVSADPAAAWDLGA